MAFLSLYRSKPKSKLIEIPAVVLKNRLLMKCSLMFTSLSSNYSDLSEASIDVQNKLINQHKLNTLIREFQPAY